MPTISIEKFSGIAPRYAARKLNPSYAQKAVNCDLWSGEARSLRDNIIVDTPAKQGVIQSIFKLGNLYLHWNEDVDVVRAPLSTSDSDRIYYSGHYNAKSTNLELAQNGAGSEYPIDWYRLGLPSPENAASLAITGGSAPVETRNYVYTYVTAWGEESPPSPIVTETGNADGSWDLSAIDVAPLNTGTITDIVVSGGKTTFTVSSDHTLETGDYVNLADIVATGEIEDAFNDVGPLQVTKLTNLTYSIPLTPAGSYTSGGTWSREANIQTTDMVKRIYRSISGDLRFVAEIPVAQTTYSDVIDSTLLGESLPSTDWVSPPPDIKGLIILPNGVLAGFSGNTLYLSEPFVPHAFPTAYDKRFSYEIVGIASIGSTIVVATKGNPYIVIGSDPAIMSDDELDLFQACVSKRSVVSVKNGVIYASPDGLVYVPSAGAPTIITRDWLKEVDWRKFNPYSMNGVVYDDRYYAFYSDAQEDIESAGSSGAIVFDPSESDSTFTTLVEFATAAYNHLEDDSMYLMVGDDIVNFGRGGGYGSLEWKSKLFTTSDISTMQAGQVKFSFDSGINQTDQLNSIEAAVSAIDALGGVASGALAGSAVCAYAVASGPYINATYNIVENVRAANFRLYVSGELHYDKQLSDSRPFRIPGGYNSDEYEIELTGSSVNFHEVSIAETISDLQKT